MKTLKYFISAIIAIIVIWSCTDDEFGNLDFVSSATAPTNVTASFKVTQDNTGLVSIAPSADGAVKFDIHYGDDTTEPTKVNVGAVASHTYEEGSYAVKIVAYNITGLKTEVSKDLMVSFQAPQFGSDPIIENDALVSKQVNVTVPDDTEFAMFFDVSFVEEGIETILSANVGETVSFVYANPGLYDIKVVLKGGAIATTEFLASDFEVTEILAPVESALSPPGRNDEDLISIFSDVYTDVGGTDFNPWWWQETVYSEFDLNGDKMIQYANLNYQGIQIGETINVAGMEYLHVDIWTPDLAEVNIYPLPVGVTPENERFVTLQLTADEWNSFDIPMSDFTDQGLPVDNIHQFKFTGENSGTIFVDNLYFWKTPAEISPLAGTWKIAPETGAIAVGDSPDNYAGWWYLNQWGDDVTARACWLDDEYVFNNDGSFQNIVGESTWLEPWQGVDPEGCGTPIAPHDGSNPATWSSTDTHITVSGEGAFIGLAKVHNTGEDGNPPSNSVTYEYVLADDGLSMELKVTGFNGGGETWYMKLVKEVDPLVGTWKVAPETGAIAVGDSPDNYTGWWFLNQWGDDVAARACWLDDEYVFNMDGSFQNILGDSTWLEPWQGVDPEGCGAPIAPHNGSNPATWSRTDNTITVSGEGAFLGLAKVHNSGEDGNPPSNSVTYDYTLSPDGSSMELIVTGFNGGGETWYIKMVKQ